MPTDRFGTGARFHQLKCAQVANQALFDHKIRRAISLIPLPAIPRQAPQCGPAGDRENKGNRTPAMYLGICNGIIG